MAYRKLTGPVKIHFRITPFFVRNPRRPEFRMAGMITHKLWRPWREGSQLLRSIQHRREKAEVALMTIRVRAALIFGADQFGAHGAGPGQSVGREVAEV